MCVCVFVSAVRVCTCSRVCVCVCLHKHRKIKLFSINVLMDLFLALINNRTIYFTTWLSCFLSHWAVRVSPYLWPSYKIHVHKRVTSVSLRKGQELRTWAFTIPQSLLGCSNSVPVRSGTMLFYPGIYREVHYRERERETPYDHFNALRCCQARILLMFL